MVGLYREAQPRPVAQVSVAIKLFEHTNADLQAVCFFCVDCHGDARGAGGYAQAQQPVREFSDCAS